MEAEWLQKSILYRKQEGNMTNNVIINESGDALNITNSELFTNSEFGELEVIEVEGKFLFPATECAVKLGYNNPYDAIVRHCESLVKREVPHPQSNNKTIEKNYISEGNLYRLIVHSKLPRAKEFEKWVFDEVLPSIRKHGAYMTPQMVEEVLSNPDTIIRLATDLKAEREKSKMLECKIEEDKPKVEFYNAVGETNSTILIRDLAKLLCENGVQTGQNRLYKTLREDGFLIKKEGLDFNMPTQRSVEAGLFMIKEYSVRKGEEIIVKKSVRVTGKGQQYLLQYYMGKNS